jgi:hypothetical protein
MELDTTELDEQILLSMSGLASQPPYQEANQGDHFLRLLQSVKGQIATIQSMRASRMMHHSHNNLMHQSHVMYQSSSLSSSAINMQPALGAAVSKQEIEAIVRATMEDWRVDRLLVRHSPELGNDLAAVCFCCYYL